MKDSIIAAFAAVLMASTLQAQETNTTPDRHVKSFNCINLRNKPQVCVLNETNMQVVGLDCEKPGGFFSSTSTKSVVMPGGNLQPHSFSVVDMQSCHTTLIFTMSDGRERRLEHVNTDTATIIEVPSK